MNTRSLPRNALAKPPTESTTVKAAGKHAWWPWLRRLVVFGFLATVVVLLVRYARGVDWDEVLRSMKALPVSTLLLAGAFAALSHTLYSCFDLIGRQYTGHRMPAWRVMQTAFVSYAFNLNMGSTVGGVGMRLRLYPRFGVEYADVARILTLSMLSNWLGCLLVAGVLFMVVPLALPPDWKLDNEGLRLLGIGLFAAALSYLLLCRLSRTRSWTIRGHELILPAWRMSLVQAGLSATNWCVVGAVIWTLLQGRIDYPSVLAVLFIAAMAGLIVRVPAGLGVLEAVFIALLSHRVPEAQMLGALLAYRGIYYIAPLGVAAVMYVTMEMAARKRAVA